MTLSDGLIYFGVVCFLLGILIILADHKLNKKTGGNKELAERIIFYKNKWNGEHAGHVLAPFGVAVLMTILSCFTDMVALLYLAGVVVLVAYIFIYNKMMIYVEANAFGIRNEDAQHEVHTKNIVP